jgi:hypothetical protein
MLVGSKSALTIDVANADRLFREGPMRDDLERVNIFSPYDFFGGFLMDQDSIAAFAGGAALNTDDLPRVIFSKFKLGADPVMGLDRLVRYRSTIFPHLSDVGADSLAAVKQTVGRDFEAATLALEGGIVERNEFALRMTQRFNGRSKAAVLENLYASRALFGQAISKYRASLQLNPDDRNTGYSLQQASSEYEYLNSFLESVNGSR